ncbi:MAG: hypothetical protein HOA24_03260 [Candidatus Pacebacteria bacterium]|jgi:hypothetical protein|nr:hypothetical protein [Candidatus Paceibacterota bacterium]MBT4004838.1 hypothetical protein [Candidatus Paceibacterota bacterium]MBT6898990.1 hypothetical protein [Candidatus Paceibacterota bacterium]MBT7183812.1 hypothetical protein [Candidatus Paceibacterota bacterium]MBT7499161.1 hypothetical protein [Candidatus Paceibacterota bacterium]
MLNLVEKHLSLGIKSEESVELYKIYMTIELNKALHNKEISEEDFQEVKELIEDLGGVCEFASLEDYRNDRSTH